jgi:hypothetical protein
LIDNLYKKEEVMDPIYIPENLKNPSLIFRLKVQLQPRMEEF